MSWPSCREAVEAISTQCLKDKPWEPALGQVLNANFNHHHDYPTTIPVTKDRTLQGTITHLTTIVDNVLLPSRHRTRPLAYVLRALFSIAMDAIGQIHRTGSVVCPHPRQPVCPGSASLAQAKEVTAGDADAIESVGGFQVKKRRRNLKSAPKPTAQDEGLAEQLTNHTKMLGILLKARNAVEEWDPKDKVGDRVPDDYEPRLPIALEKGPSLQVVKRRRTASLALQQQWHTSEIPLPSRPAKTMFK
ncbi:hypothetical protein NUW54_g4095 [Trametes sanguinea]|uniref:Uncharacterized protein n=1 Tax=Trametes sanguinea TaxID=158606 RepID=A0ACC1Q2G6_9APHY|nr:hypothetical protein NUW54_g4095 [Trametes sanguinea]